MIFSCFQELFRKSFSLVARNHAGPKVGLRTGYKLSHQVIKFGWFVGGWKNKIVFDFVFFYDLVIPDLNTKLWLSYDYVIG